MTDLHDRLAQRQRELLPDPGGFDRLVRRRRRREISRRVAAGIVAVILASGVASLLTTLRPGGAAVPAITPETVSTLRVAWRAWVAGSPSAPTIAGGSVFVSADRLYAFPLDCEARAACEPLWTGDIRVASTVPPVVGDDVVVATSAAGLTAFDAACRHDAGTCRPLWVAPSPPPNVPEGGAGVEDSVTLGFSEPVIDGGEVIVSGPGGLYVFRSDCRTDGGPCRPTWSSPGTGGVGAPEVEADVIYVHAHGELQAFPRACPASHCPVLWTATLPEYNVSSVTAASHIVFVGGVGYRWNGDRLVRVWRSAVADVSGPFSPVLVHDGMVYVSSDRVSASPIRCGETARACPPAWSTPERFDVALGQALTWSEPVAAGGLIFSSAGMPAAFIERCGVAGNVCRPVWTGQAAVGTSRPAVSSSALVVTTSAGGVVAYAPSAA